MPENPSWNPTVDNSSLQQPQEDNRPWFMKYVMDPVNVAGNAITMGLLPRAVGVFDEERADRIRQNIGETRERMGGVGTAIDFAASMATPLPGLGVGGALAKGATKLGAGGAISKGLGFALNRIVRPAATGAVTGGIAAGINKLAEKDTGLEDIGQAALGGMETGAMLGGGLGAAGALINRFGIPERMRFAATGATAGPIRKTIKQYTGRPDVGLAKSEETMRHGQEALGLIGRPFQSVNDVYQRALDAADKSGQVIGTIVEEAEKAGVRVPVNRVWDVYNETVGSMVKPGFTATPGTERVMSELFNDILPLGANAGRAGTLGKPGQTVGIEDLWRYTHQYKEDVGFKHSGEGGKIDSSLGERMLVLKNKLRGLVDEAVENWNPEKGAIIKQENKNYHAANMFARLARGGHEAELGLLPTIFGMGVRAPVTYAGLRMAGVPPTIGVPLSSFLSQGGRIPNTALWLNEVLTKGDPGQLAGRLTRFGTQSNEPANQSYSPRTPLMNY